MRGRAGQGRRRKKGSQVRKQYQGRSASSGMRETRAKHDTAVQIVRRAESWAGRTGRGKLMGVCSVIAGGGSTDAATANFCMQHGAAHQKWWRLRGRQDYLLLAASSSFPSLPACFLTPTCSMVSSHKSFMTARKSSCRARSASWPNAAFSSRRTSAGNSRSGVRLLHQASYTNCRVGRGSGMEREGGQREGGWNRCNGA